MKITQKGSYALKAVLDLSVHYGEGLATIQAIANRIAAPAKFLEQVLVELKRAGFIESRRGKVGGYRLSRSPSNITLGEIVQFIDGSFKPVSENISDRPTRGDSYREALTPVWQRVLQATSDIIDHITFEDLATKVCSVQNEPTYAI